MSEQEEGHEGSEPQAPTPIAGASTGFSSTTNMQLLMPWFMGAGWVPKFNGDKTKYLDWQAQVEMMLRAQGLSQQQQVDFIFTSLEGDAKRQAILFNVEDRRDGAKLLGALKRLYGETAKKGQLRSRFYNCKQEPQEGLETLILKLRETYSKWQEKEPGERDGNEDLLDQFATGLQPGTLRTEIHRQLRRNPQLTFSAICTEASALEREQQHGEEETWTRRTFNPRPRESHPNLQTTSIPDMTQLKGELRAELQKELMEQLKSMTAIIAEEVRKQLSPTLQGLPSNNPSSSCSVPPPRRRAPGALSSQTREREFSWDQHGRPICRDCGESGHVQGYCPHRLSRPTGF